jgi:hypothetical protein
MCDVYEVRLMDELSELGIRLTDDKTKKGSNLNI